VVGTIGNVAFLFRSPPTSLCEFKDEKMAPHFACLPMAGDVLSFLHLYIYMHKTRKQEKNPHTPQNGNSEFLESRKLLPQSK
jgi:hypothetical protein